MIAALMVVAGLAGAAPEVSTATRDSRACQPLADGRVVVGTAGGLLVVDANDRVGPVHTALSGLPGTRVHSLAVGGYDSRKPVLWIGTEGGTARVTVADDGGVAVLATYPSAPARAVIGGSSPIVGTWGDGVNRVAGSRLEALGGPRQTAALARHGGALYAGGPAGLFRRDSQGWTEVVALRGRMVQALADEGGILRVGTLTGELALRGEEASVISNADVRSFAPGLVGTFGEGSKGGPPDLRYVYDVTVAHGAACVAARSGVRVRRGDRWVGPALTGPPDNDISALRVDGSRLWVGTFDRGVAWMEGGVWHTVPGVDPRVNAIAIQGGTAWVATARGLFAVRVTDGVGTARRYGVDEGLPSDDIRSVSALPDGRVLVGTARAAAFVGPDGVAPLGRKQRLYTRSVWASHVDADGGLWIGTSRGVLYRRKGRKWFRRYSVASGHLKDDWVTSIVADPTGKVWVGTYNGGVHRFEGKTSEWVGGGWVNPAGLHIDGNHILASTMDGLFRRPLEGGEWAPIGEAAPGRDITATARIGDRLWVGSRRGLASRRNW
ncbi:MAG: hypothetical protein ACI9WU_003011 [Myxococcota bacterium]